MLSTLLKIPFNILKYKYIDIKHHFIKDHVQKGDIKLSIVNTEDQIANIFTKR